MRRFSADEMRKRAPTLLRPLHLRTYLPPTPSNSARDWFFRSSSSSPSSSSSSSSSSRLNAQNYRLRKRRKWPLSPYKAKWHESFEHKQAMQALKQSAIVSSSTTTHLLSTLIDSFAAYNCDPTPDAYHFVIRTLAKSSKWDQIPPVLDRLETVENFQPPEFIFVDLIRIYGDSSMIQHAIDLFFRIPSFGCAPSVDSLNSLLLVLSKKREGVMIVPQILLKSQLMNIRVEESSFRIMIKALCRIRQVVYAIKLLNFMVSYGNCVLDQSLCSLILSTLCEGKDLSGVDLMGFFQDMRKLGFYPTSLDWCNVIRFQVKKGKGEQAFETLKKMKVAGIKPDAVCYTLVMDAAVADGRFERADQLLDEMLVLGLVPDIHTYNVYINSLCKQGKVEEGFKMLACMEELGCKPVAVTYNVLLQGFCKSSRLNRATEIVKEMELKGMQLGPETYGIVIDGLVKAGEIDEACCWLREMLDDKGVFPMSSTLDIVICEFCQRGLASKAVELLKETIGKRVVPGIKAWEALLASEFNSVGAEIPVETGIIGSADHKMRA